MKILHFADLHLGVESYGHINPETGLSTRLEDFLKALDQVVDYALENRVDLVLFCGDAYKSREPSKTLPGLANFYMAGQWVMPGGGLPSGIMTGRYVTQIICKQDKKKFVTSTP